MARFIMSNRRAGKFTDDQKLASRHSLEVSLDLIRPSITTVADRSVGETTRRTIVLEAEPSEIEAKRGAFGPDVMIEPEIIHHKLDDSVPFDLLRAVPLDVAPAFERAPALAAFLGSGGQTTVTVRGAGSGPLVGAEVDLFLAGPGDLRERLEARTDASGVVTFQYAGFFSVLGVIVSPYGGFWPTIVRGGGANISVSCRRLPRRGPRGWWHNIMNARTNAPKGGVRDGSNIRVGVIDSGCGPHPDLGHVENCGAIIDGLESTDPAAGLDSGSHGTHVCGTIGARPGDRNAYAGVATGADLFSVRVFPPGRGANQGDIADAIDLLSREKRVDLINMSLGAPFGSQIEQDAIIDAQERGTLCVCAAGNSAGDVGYPAAFPETVAVAAIGRLGWVPAESFPALPSDPALFGSQQLHASDFTCFGPEVTCAAGGVGIISTVPERFGHAAPYAAMNGTSMASPAACGALAGLLSRDRDYKLMERNEARTNYARSVLIAHCRDIGLPGDYQGRGVPAVR